MEKEKDMFLLPMNLQYFAEKEEELDDEDLDDEGKGDEGKDGTESTTKKSEGKKEEPKTFTQEQVNKMMSREKRQGKSSVYTELGIDPKDTKAISMLKALIASQKTEEEKPAEVATEERRKAEELERRAFLAEAKVEAIRLGVQPKYVDDAITLAVAKKGEDDELKDIIGEFKTKYPSWFESSQEDDDKNVGKKGTGSAIKSGKSKKGGEETLLGARLAAKRASQNKKSSYWG